MGILSAGCGVAKGAMGWGNTARDIQVSIITPSNTVNV